MNLPLIRLGLMAGAVVGAALLGRRAVDKQIERRMSAATEEAIRLAEEELDKSVRTVLRERVVNFARTMALKFLLLGIAVGCHGLGFLTMQGLKVAVISLGVAYIIFDLRDLLPKMIPALTYARKHRFRPRAMITEAIAAAAFEQAYDRASREIDGNSGRHWVAISSFDPHALSTEIAEAVAEVARHTSYDKVKPRALLFAAGVALTSLSYAALAFFIVHL